jgi:hypothetical protein
MPMYYTLTDRHAVVVDESRRYEVLRNKEYRRPTPPTVSSPSNVVQNMNWKMCYVVLKQHPMLILMKPYKREMERDLNAMEGRCRNAS